jgi:hypothetical protein
MDGSGYAYGESEFDLDPGAYRAGSGCDNFGRHARR